MLKSIKKSLAVVMATVMAVMTFAGCSNTAAKKESDTVKWFNASAAVLTYANKMDCSVYGGTDNLKFYQENIKTLLKNSWEVTDRATADETLKYVLEEGNRKDFAADVEFLKSIGFDKVAEDDRIQWMIQNYSLSAKDADYCANAYKMYETAGDHAIDAWDYSRAMSLLGFYYVAGYYTKEEALNKSLEVAKEAQAIFASWDEFMESYFRGYEYWSEESSSERRSMYNSICNDKSNPFEVDFKTELTKTW